MARLFENRVVFVTGAARGQGRSHAVRFAREGAAVIAVDLCRQIDSVAYPMAGSADLRETVRLVEEAGGRILAEEVDVRDLDALCDVVERGVARFGRLDFVLANAGIAPGAGAQAHHIDAYLDSIAVNLNGVYFTIEAALPALLAHDDGGAIVITSSAAGLKSGSRGFAVKNHGGAGYTAAKHGVVGLMRYYASTLAEKRIRVNSVHPSGVGTPMILNKEMAQFSAEHPDHAEALTNLLPVPYMDVADITEAMVYLCGPAGRYVTGVALPVDAGLLLK